MSELYQACFIWAVTKANIHADSLSICPFDNVKGGIKIVVKNKNEKYEATGSMEEVVENFFDPKDERTKKAKEYFKENWEYTYHFTKIYEQTRRFLDRK